MGREVRKVPKNWEHPRDHKGDYIPLLKGYLKDAKEFIGMVNDEGLQKAIEYVGCPDKSNYMMPDWEESEATYFMMYENTSEGTPLSPAFETPEELAKWLVDNNISSIASMTASYESWLAICKGGYAPKRGYD